MGAPTKPFSIINHDFIICFVLLVLFAVISVPTDHQFRYSGP
jgi:hypothetical protein